MLAQLGRTLAGFAPEMRRLDVHDLARLQGYPAHIIHAILDAGIGGPKVRAAFGNTLRFGVVDGYYCGIVEVHS